VTTIGRGPEQPNMMRATKLTSARRIAATTLAMWKHQEDYVPSKQRHASQSK
jgi:hypothetical protein